ncbi:hypothetical protein PHYPSEUDO_001065 [Phytophthora pseudosyringae]|uniref:EGF-like domain-containing protein n=1 Tax=Phytophthora pseudosyringae TaxID=221518 RepID=A0A8T1W0U0_9STRA|nr:hypothetical protein PHYPSEUDO_001065 [Phytophthora pseudosyringae]
MGGRRKVLLASGLVLVAVALLSVPTIAECPNGCSGNGACMAKDMCNCYKNYHGNDCLDRTCQFGYAHADTPKGDINMDQDRKTANWILTDSQQDPAGTYEYFNPNAAVNEAHFYMECSNKGLCDRALGVCTCFDGYEGAACQRAACPNKCSGHGTCESVRELGLKAPGTLFGIPDSSTAVSYDLWDSRVTYGCRCDPWYGGADCTLRSCKVGVDPMFLSTGSATYETFALHVYLDTTITTWTADAGDYFRLRLFDYHGEAYITEPIHFVTDVALIDAKANAAAVAAAIKKIPNQTFRTVLCEPTSVTANLGVDLEGYLSKRTASTLGMSVVCQFISNPGRLRAPEVAALDFKMNVNPSLEKSEVITMEEGMDNEWFTQDTGITYVSIDSGFTVITVTNPNAIADETNPMLFKIGPHVVVGKYALDTTPASPALPIPKLTLTYPIQHTLSTSMHRFDAVKAASVAGGIAVTQLIIPVAGGVAVGATTISVTTNPSFAAGDLIFFENQFYNYVSVAAPISPATAYVITLDRKFVGNTLDGGANTVLFVYKVTPPKNALWYNYVSQCSGRGLCATETGICSCFKGYTNDNCDTQNILAL